MHGGTYPDGIVQAYSYDSLNRLNTLAINKNGVATKSYSYTLDPAGNRLSVAELGGRTVSYTYDALYRLTSESVAGGVSAPNGTVGYAYDLVGNRTQTASTLAGISPALFSYDPDDRLSLDTYDAAGNTISSDGTGNVYDFENRLVQHGSITMVYDGDGNRVAETVGGVTTYLIDDRNPTGYPQVIAETSSDGSTRTYVYGLERISQRQFIPSSNSFVVSFYLYDGHSSVRALADSTGAITDTYDYDAHGNLINRTGTTPNDYLFAGEQFDPTLGIYYNRARYYDERRGRFWTMDAVEGSVSDPQSLHKYLYTDANPVSRRDPSGNQGDLTEEAIVTEITAELAIETGTAATASGVGTATFVTGAADTVPLALAETEAVAESVLVVGSAGAVELTAAQEALLLDLEIEIEIDTALAAEIVAENASLFGTLGFNVSNIVEGTLSGTELAALFRFLGW